MVPNITDDFASKLVIDTPPPKTFAYFWLQNYIKTIGLIY